MRSKLVAGNWKMYGDLDSNERLLSAVSSGLRPSAVELAVCAPFPYLAQVQAALSGGPIAWGAQNLSEHAEGAYTGEVSGAMLCEFSCRYVIVGHSERRSLYGETDSVVAAKFVAAQSVGLVPILCVGERLEEREAGNTEAVVKRQLRCVIDRIGVAALRDAVLAYEPVWAIGTGKTATPDQAQAVHALLRSEIAKADGNVARELRMLYGGSVKPATAAELFAMPDIDGGLIGGASLVAGDFLAIAHALALVRAGRA